MSLPKVLLTRHWPESVEAAMAAAFDITLNHDDQPLDSRQIAQALEEYDAICPCVADPITSEVLSGNNIKTRIIANYGVGFNNIDTAMAKSKGLVVTNTPDVLTHATADLAMTLMLMVARRTTAGERQIQSGQWHGWYPTHLMGSMVSGKTLGIIGMGRIGQAMAEKAQNGFGMRILYHNRRAKSDLGNLNAEYCQDLETILPQCDYVSLHCPAGSDTKHLINTETLGLMKPEAFLINTARGDLVDEKALIKALEKGQIAGAGMDVFEQEPSVPEALKQMDNVALLPHLGSATLETRTAMGMRVFQNLQAFFNGVEPPDRVA